jgi:hypothetical protein
MKRLQRNAVTQLWKLDSSSLWVDVVMPIFGDFCQLSAILPIFGDFWRKSLDPNSSAWHLYFLSHKKNLSLKRF